MYRCPYCGELLPTLNEAATHCAQNDGTGGGTSASVEPVSELVALGEDGQPLITRQLDPTTGRAHTIVQNEDGTCAAFGANTIDSMVASAEGDTEVWMSELPQHHMHALAHEMGRRLVEASKIFQAQKSVLDERTSGDDYKYFGLDEYASDKDVEAAYRRLARQMHPDKNGGTRRPRKNSKQ